MTFIATVTPCAAYLLVALLQDTCVTPSKMSAERRLSSFTDAPVTPEKNVFPAMKVARTEAIMQQAYTSQQHPH